MQIPKLEKAFCGMCTLETGTKVIAWIQLVFQLLILVVAVIIVATGSALMANFFGNLNQSMENKNNVDDNRNTVFMHNDFDNFGKKLDSEIEDHFNTKSVFKENNFDNFDNELDHLNPLIEDDIEDDDDTEGVFKRSVSTHVSFKLNQKTLMDIDGNDIDHAKAVFMGFGIVFVVIFLVIFLIEFTATILLLLGAQKKKPGYMVFWMVLSVLTLIGSIGGLGLSGVVYAVINAYCIWVVYSHYMQLKDNRDTSKLIAGEGY